MSRNASIELDWAESRFTFRLAWAELILLQETLDRGPYAILERLSGNDWRVEEISHVLRLGLIGGGMEPTTALRLVRSYVEDRPPLENLTFAQAVLAAACIGAPEEEVGSKKKPRARKAKPSD